MGKYSKSCILSSLGKACNKIHFVLLSYLMIVTVSTVMLLSKVTLLWFLGCIKYTWLYSFAVLCIASEKKKNRASGENYLLKVLV